MVALHILDKEHHKASLFERLQSDKSSAAKGKIALVLSIKKNLQRIFNARPGECHGSQELGIIDINDALLSSEEIQSAICNSIQHCIERYEPRISHVNVTMRQDSITFFHYFSITAYIKHINEHDKIEIDIYINDNKLKVI